VRVTSWHQIKPWFLASISVHLPPSATISSSQQPLPHLSRPPFVGRRLWVDRSSSQTLHVHSATSAAAASGVISPWKPPSHPSHSHTAHCHTALRTTLQLLIGTNYSLKVAAEVVTTTTSHLIAPYSTQRQPRWANNNNNNNCLTVFSQKHKNNNKWSK